MRDWTEQHSCRVLKGRFCSLLFSEHRAVTQKILDWPAYPLSLMTLQMWEATLTQSWAIFSQFLPLWSIMVVRRGWLPGACRSSKENQSSSLQKTLGGVLYTRLQGNNHPVCASWELCDYIFYFSGWRYPWKWLLRYTQELESLLPPTDTQTRVSPSPSMVPSSLIRWHSGALEDFSDADSKGPLPTN